MAHRHRPLDSHSISKARTVFFGMAAAMVLVQMAIWGLGLWLLVGVGRSGSVYELKLDPDVLIRAFQNTVTLLKTQVVVQPE